MTASVNNNISLFFNDMVVIHSHMVKHLYLDINRVIANSVYILEFLLSFRRISDNK